MAEATQLASDDTLIFNPNPTHAPEQDYTLPPELASWLPTETMLNVYLAHNFNTRGRTLLDINTSTVRGPRRS